MTPVFFGGCNGSSAKKIMNTIGAQILQSKDIKFCNSCQKKPCKTSIFFQTLTPKDFISKTWNLNLMVFTLNLIYEIENNNYLNFHFFLSLIKFG